MIVARSSTGGGDCSASRLTAAVTSHEHRTAAVHTLPDEVDICCRNSRTKPRQGLQKDLRALAANIRADAEGRYDRAEPGWRSGVEGTLLRIEKTAAQLA